MRLRRDIQGLRAVAVVLVVLFHVGVLVPGGFIGVDVFFVLSGFLITSLMLREVEARGRLDLTGFILRRARRILPLLSVVLLSVIALLAFIHPLGPEFDASIRTARGAALMFANLTIYRQGGYFGEDPETNAFLHTWSLAVEEQFYIAYPVLIVAAVWSASRLGRSWRGVVGLSLLLIASGSLLLSLALTYGVPGVPLEAGPRFAFLSPITRVWQFGTGAALALGLPGGIAALARRPGAAPVGLALIGISAVAFGQGTAYPGLAAVVPTVGTALVLLGGEATSRHGLLGARPLVWIGDRSYGWYLWHWPLIVIGRSGGLSGVVWAGALSIGALALAAASFRLVEQPFRRGAMPVRVVVPAAVAMLVAPAVVATAVAATGTRAAADSLPGATHEGLSAADLLGFRGAVDVAPFNCLDDPSPCRPSGASLTVLVVGDSLAASLLPGLRGTLEDGTVVVRAAVRAGCPVLDPSVAVPGGPGGRCAGMLDAVLGVVDRWRPDVIVVHQYGPGYVTGTWAGAPDADSLVVGAEGIPLGTPSDRASLYEAALLGALRALSDDGRRLVVVGPPPDFDDAPVVRYPTLVAASSGASATLAAEAIPLDDVIARAGLVRQVEQTAAVAAGAAFVDAIPPLCRPDGCSRFEGELPLYRDPIHLTPAGAAMLAGAVTPVVLDSSG